MPKGLLIGYAEKQIDDLAPIVMSAGPSSATVRPLTHHFSNKGAKQQLIGDIARRWQRLVLRPDWRSGVRRPEVAVDHAECT